MDVKSKDRPSEMNKRFNADNKNNGKNHHITKAIVDGVNGDKAPSLQERAINDNCLVLFSIEHKHRCHHHRQRAIRQPWIA